MKRVVRFFDSAEIDLIRCLDLMALEMLCVKYHWRRWL
jgi:hypothetical protein